MLIKLLFPIIIYFVVFYCENGEASERDVFAQIFQNYERRIRPIRNDSQVILVRIQMNIISLLEVNEQQEYVKLSVNFDHKWHDDFLTWDPAKFNGTTNITVPADMVWRPDVTVVSTVLDAEYIIEREDMQLQIEYTGDIWLGFPYVLSNRCTMKTDNFPFDLQECLFVLSSWAFGTDQMLLEHIDGQGPLQNPNTEWDVFPYTNQTVDVNFGREFRHIIYHLKMKRKSSYYVWVIIAPTFIISALNIAGIFAPFSSTGDREEKITLGLTTLLTLAVILSLVTGDLPRATNLPLLGRFILFEISICVICMALSVCTMFLHQRAITRQWTVPRWLMKPVLCHRNDRIKAGCEVKRPPSALSADQKCKEWLRKNEESLPSLSFQHLNETVADIKQLLAEHHEAEHRRSQWLLLLLNQRNKYDKPCTTLENHFQSNYERRLRPVLDEGTVILVQIQLNLISLLEVNAPQEYVKFALNFDHNWHDDFLTWDPLKFNGTKRIKVPADMVWRPDITVISTVLEAEQIIAREDLFLEISYNGHIHFSFPIVLFNHCQMKTNDFPFDSQDFTFELMSWSYSTDELDIVHKEGNIEVLYNNTEWEIFPYENETAIVIDGNSSYRVILYHQKIKRKYTYYIWVIIVPTFVITALSIAGIFAPFSNTGDREEKITLGLTTLLTLAVILSLVTGEMPRATNLPQLGRFIMFEIVVCVIAMALSVCTMFLHQRATTRHWAVPHWLMKTVLRNRNDRVKAGCDVTTPEKALDECKDLPKNQESAVVCFQQLSEAVAKLNCFLEETEMMEFRKDNWTLIMDYIDLTFLLGFQIVHAIYFVVTFRT